MIRAVALALAAIALCVAFAAPASAHTLPATGDHFSYYETILLTNGQGNYTGYAEGQFINGSLSVSAIATNETDSATYQSSDHFENNQGQSSSSPGSGSFTFSASTFHYVQGTDNQTGYVNPYVWFYIDNTLAPSAPFTLLNTPFTVQSVSAAYPISSSSTGFIKTISADGTGSYQRDDVYGVFTAQYSWQVYFDPTSGYIVGYLYSENDTDSAGDSFTWTDSLAVTSTSYALTPTAAPPPPPPSSSAPPAWTYLVLGLVILVVIILIVVAVLAASRRRRAPLARHSVQGSVQYAPAYAPPPGLNFGTGSQPAVQQIVIKETVKVPCRYCGTLIDSTATACPKCGAPRT